MPRKMTIVYTSTLSPGAKRAPTNAYYLATTADRMQFYCFDEPKEVGGSWTLIDELDRTKLLAAGNKETAKIWAKNLGLTS